MKRILIILIAFGLLYFVIAHSYFIVRTSAMLAMVLIVLLVMVILVGYSRRKK